MPWFQGGKKLPVKAQIKDVDVTQRLNLREELTKHLPEDLQAIVPLTHSQLINLITTASKGGPEAALEYLSVHVADNIPSATIMPLSAYVDFKVRHYETTFADLLEQVTGTKARKVTKKAAKKVTKKTTRKR